MPELPEVERLRCTLLPHLLGHRFERVRVRRAGVIDGPRTPRALLVGGTGSSIARIARRGKQMALVAHDSRVLVIHLGMTGQVLCQPAANLGRAASAEGPLPAGAVNDPHVHVMWTTEIGTRVVFRDPRRFGGLWPLAGPAALDRRWAALGPDALTIAPEALAAGLAGSRRAIKAALLDQTVLAGVGNIYADEACFIAGVRPARKAQRLKGDEITRLAGAIRTVLSSAVAAGGSTLRDYRNADGEAGTFVSQHAVYGRGGKPCLRCGTTLRQATLAQRTTVWCPNCQR